MANRGAAGVAWCGALSFRILVEFDEPRLFSWPERMTLLGIDRSIIEDEQKKGQREAGP